MNAPFPWIRWTLFLSLAAAPLAAETVDYEYDTAGRLIGVRHAGGLRIQYLYDAAGNLLVRRYQSLVDTDRDGMDDAWETAYFKTLARDGTGDLDGDDSSDRSEFLAGTDPTSALSVLKVTRVESAGGLSVRVEWQSVAGRTYRVQYTDGLVDTAWEDLPGDVTAAGTTAIQSDPSPKTPRFYRVLLVR